MKRDDWIGIGVSVAAHALLLFIVIAATPPPQPPDEQLGLLAVEFGPVEVGRKAPVPQPQQTQQTPQRQNQPQREQPRRATTRPARPATNPVKLPDAQEAPSKDRVAPTRTSEAPPQPASEQTPSRTESRDDGAARQQASASGAPSGSGDEATRRSPFSIEGLNRQSLRTPLPRNTANTVATLRVEIVVAPDGSVTFGRWIQKGNATLEREVLDAVRRWRFNALPGRAPQVDQKGTVTFRFVVE